jgi:hypothetical protein
MTTVKLTAEQRSLLDDTVLAVLRDQPQAARFNTIDQIVRTKLADKLPPRDVWFRYTDGALQRLRKRGLAKMQYQRWSPVPKSAS